MWVWRIAKYKEGDALLGQNCCKYESHETSFNSRLLLCHGEFSTAIVDVLGNFLSIFARLYNTKF